MAAGLRRYEVFAAVLDEAEEQLKRLGASWSLKGMFLPSPFSTCMYIIQEED